MLSSRRRLILPFLAPALFFYVVFWILPALGSVWISLHAWSGPGSDFAFIGLKNFQSLITDPVYHQSLTNTLEILLLLGPVVFALSFAFTMALHKLPGRRLVRAVVFFPNVIPPVAISVVWVFMLAPNIGLVNNILRAVRLSALARPWLSPELIFPSIMVGLGWVFTGFFTVIVLAAVDRIPAEYFEASEIEGAGGLQRFIHVTLPMTRDVVSIAVVLWVITAVKTFDFIYVLAGVGQSPPTRVWTLALHMFLISIGTREAINDLGLGSAIAVTMVAIVAVLVVIVRRGLYREALEY